MNKSTSVIADIKLFNAISGGLIMRKYIVQEGLFISFCYDQYDGYRCSASFFGHLSQTETGLNMHLHNYILSKKVIKPYFIIALDHQIYRFQKKIIVQSLELKIVYHKNHWLIARRDHANSVYFFENSDIVYLLCLVDG